VFYVTVRTPVAVQDFVDSGFELTFLYAGGAKDGMVRGIYLYFEIGHIGDGAAGKDVLQRVTTVVYYSFSNGFFQFFFTLGTQRHICKLHRYIS
jgi:hypothetical protein